MTDSIEAHYIKGVPWGGAANEGQQILFRLSFHGDQPDVNFACDFAFVPLLLGNLTEYARRAEAQRVRSAETIHPYLVTEVAKSGITTDKKLVWIDFNTNQGFPLSVAMTSEQAQQTIDLLVRQMMRLRTAGPARTN
ncbi:MAG: hypothetical protein WCA54_08440 [Pseudolabrys sp.]